MHLQRWIMTTRSVLPNMDEGIAASGKRAPRIAVGAYQKANRGGIGSHLDFTSTWGPDNVCSTLTRAWSNLIICDGKVFRKDPARELFDSGEVRVRL